MNSEIEIYTDGSSLGNPGPGGWGVVFVITKNKPKPEIVDFGGYEKETTNNRMELTAVIEALNFSFAKQELVNKKIKIYTDSSYVLVGITSWVNNWEKNGWKTANKKPVLNQDLWKKLVPLSRELGDKLSWQKVKGHSGHIYNDRADEIATTFAKKQNKK